MSRRLTASAQKKCLLTFGGRKQACRCFPQQEWPGYFSEKEEEITIEGGKKTSLIPIFIRGVEVVYVNLIRE